MEVGVGVLRHVVVEHDVDSLDVHAAAEQVGGDQDSLLEIFELLVAGQTLLLRHAPTNKREWLRVSVSSIEVVKSSYL